MIKIRSLLACQPGEPALASEVEYADAVGLPGGGREIGEVDDVLRTEVDGRRIWIGEYDGPQAVDHGRIIFRPLHGIEQQLAVRRKLKDAAVQLPIQEDRSAITAVAADDPGRRSGKIRQGPLDGDRAEGRLRPDHDDLGDRGTLDRGLDRSAREFHALLFHDAVGGFLCAVNARLQQARLAFRQGLVPNRLALKGQRLGLDLEAFDDARDAHDGVLGEYGEHRGIDAVEFAEAYSGRRQRLLDSGA